MTLIHLVILVADIKTAPRDGHPMRLVVLRSSAMLQSMIVNYRKLLRGNFL